MTKITNFSELVGKTLVSITHNTYTEDIIFITTDGEIYKMYHSQDCCEHVYVEDICGDLQDLVGSPILHAEENCEEDKHNSLWTFYHISTIKGSVTIRWIGHESYYSLSVDFVKLDRPR